MSRDDERRGIRPVQLTENTWVEAPTPHGEQRFQRYEDLGLIGKGGMGEVRRVRDPDLNRVMAVKILHAEVAQPQHIARFVEEAQVTAQLRHPSIVSVHELGRDEQDRIFFTMEEVRGSTLSEVIEELHAASAPQAWGRTLSGWTLERVVEAFRRACEAVAYAHARGVVHRDLKPANVMLGRFGEVILLDWGLAKVFRQGLSDDLPVVTQRSVDDGLQTVVGRVMGTPAFMPPEQARGEQDRVGTASDVYALGAILYNVLTGHAPYRGGTSQAVVRSVLNGPPRPVTDFEQAPPIPEHLAAICEKAMAREPTARHYDAMELAQDLGGWLDGSQRRAKALELVARARATLPAALTLDEEASRLRTEARELLEPIGSHEPVDRKRPAWVLEDLAEQLERKASMRVLECIRTLLSALNLAPDLADAHAALAEIYKAQHQRAERDHETEEAERLEVLLKYHDRGEHRAYLDGTGALTLVTDPPGARARLFRYAERDRRLVPELLRELGQTPIERMPLGMGTYLVELSAPGHETVRYPVVIGREEHWDGVAPGESRTRAIRLPREGELGPDDVYVPAGWFQSGDDGTAEDNALPRRRIWVDAMVFRRLPVTYGDYLEFVNDLQLKGDKRGVQRALPRFEQLSLFSQRRSGVWEIRDDLQMFRADPRHPVVMIDWFSARAYADWEAARSGQPWRLPDEISWEKAARGVDGRIYPWGNTLDPTWCNMRDSLTGRPRVTDVGAFPVDESPYGVRDLGGNAMDWCQDAFRMTGPPIHRGRAVVREDPGQPRCIRGGHFYAIGSISRTSHRYRLDPAYRGYMLGFRLARAWR